MITKVGKKYQLDFRPDGSKGKRVTRLFKLRADAVQFQQTYVSRLSETQAVQAIVDDRQLNDLIKLWFDFHGRSLKSAVDTRNRLFKLSELLGNPRAKFIDPELLAGYRTTRLNQGILPATLNRELITLKALFRELKRLSVIDYDSSVLTVRKLREAKRELSYLSLSQVERLRVQVDLTTNESLPFVVMICLVTGARWSEAEGLTVKNCINQGFQFVDTKNGNSRFVPVEESVFLYIKNRLVQGDFKSCYGAFRSAFKRAALVVPRGQLAHILRHTFASHFTMNGGNIIALQKILGHSSLNQTMKYAHLAPSYMVQALQFNPLSGSLNNPTTA
ncbi:tyrosine-type recombinase/integrase [Methylobacter sp.]|uniref:phage integrase n=1 Tax=Methylobacter sp. TaxID=2051955 RepID=UPI0024879FA4|nr:tyrosine-type recombinase/integrase [Methylobacter sp.]MDI1278643.1 tyrosine-type recombinase/integrase [Methylobacter sp.]MDI1359463.1 tyrosine-type recombinase/integrase [Methylobacter sp.]